MVHCSKWTLNMKRTFLGWPFCVILFLKQINLLFVDKNKAIHIKERNIVTTNDSLSLLFREAFYICAIYEKLYDVAKN